MAHRTHVKEEKIRMISAGNFRNGVTLEIDGQVVQILEFQHVKPGKRSCIKQNKIKKCHQRWCGRAYLPSDNRRNSAGSYQRVDMQYLYSDGDLFYFMNVENYEQIALNEDHRRCSEICKKKTKWLKYVPTTENVFAIEPPLFVELEITETEPGFKGDTAQGASKPATAETGATVSVPLFVNWGDKIKIDTQNR